MKRKKVCALLCVAAMSVTSVMPAMAADNVVPQETVTVESETEPVEEQEETLPEATPEADEEQMEEVQQVEESQTVEALNNDEKAVTDGWYVDDDGNTYYYQNGEMVTSQIVEIEDEDGNTYGYYFYSNGIMLKDDYTWCAHLDENNNLIQDQIRADEQGHLLWGWYDSHYYGKDYFMYSNKALEDEGKMYYFDTSGNLVRNQDIVIGDTFYHADDNGVLTKKDVDKEQDGWLEVGENWYYIKKGEILKNTIEEINGDKYYFYPDGKMATGCFVCGKKVLLAEPNGVIVQAGISQWYYSKQTKKWYWFDELGDVAQNVGVRIDGKNYYFNENGEMQTGAFWANYQETDGTWFSGNVYADTSGAIDRTPGWKQQGQNWYYVDSEGKAARWELVEDINGASYYFDYEGIMQTGKIRNWENNEIYMADADGAIMKNGWIQDGLEWHYAGVDGGLYVDKWLDDVFYFNDQGIMVIGKHTIDGTVYVFDENGYKKATIGKKDGWQLIDGDWYYSENGEPYNGWLDHTYYLYDGKMLTDRGVESEHSTEEDSRTSYVDCEGKIVSGWHQGMNGWLYAEKDEYGDITCVEEGWRKIGGTWYYFEYSEMASDTILQIGDELHQFAASGAWQGAVSGTGWKQTDSGDWYYINDDGKLNTENAKKINGLTYYFWGNGMMAQNEAFPAPATGKDIWINGNGNQDYTTGWKQNRYESYSWYYVENGYLVDEGVKIIGGVEYNFGGGGRLRTSEMNYDYETGKTVLYDENGYKTEVSTGWYSMKTYDETAWYYFKDSKPFTGYVGNYYVSYGRLVTGIYYSENGARYLFDENGCLFTGGWIYRWGGWYYAGSTGKLYTGEWTIDGVRYIFNNNGEWVR